MYETTDKGGREIIQIHFACTPCRFVTNVHKKHISIIIFEMIGYDCTFKESLYSTHPYLIPLNKKFSLPVMTKRSMLGHREKIGNIWDN